MLLTRSIRRKMALGLCLLMGTLALLSVGGITGLYKYRRMVKSLEFSIEKAPRNSDLIASIGTLIGPLANGVPRSASDDVKQRAYRQQRDEFERTLNRVRESVDEHFRRYALFTQELDDTHIGISSVRQTPNLHYLLRERIVDNLTDCEATLALLERPERREDAIQYMLQMIAELHAAVNNVPDPARALLVQLSRDRDDYRTHLVLVWTTSVLAILLALTLAVCAKKWIVNPIRKLDQGARRVASSADFDYRIQLDTNDEMSSLANAFNLMTERFQSVTRNLDQQVQEQTQQLVQSARLAGVGFLAAGVAHEINNPLHAIATAAEGLEYRLMGQLDGLDEADRAVVKEYLAMMQSEAARCRQITEKLLDFARGKGSEKNQYDMTAIVDDTVSVLEHVGKFRDRTIRFETEAPHYAHVNGSEIKQVILNLIANALEATEPGGAVTIELNETPDSVEFRCHDDGCGMTSDTLAHIFDPFFSTKQNRPDAKGTGLGLSISHRIVQDHHGTLEASSDGPGQGSTFRLRLPKASAKVKAA